MSSPPKSPQFFAPSEEKSTVVLVGLRSQITPTVWRPPRGKIHSRMVRKNKEERARGIPTEGKGLHDPSEWSKFSSQFFFLFACVPSQEEAKCPYFTYLFCKRMLRRNPLSTNTQPHSFLSSQYVGAFHFVSLFSPRIRSPLK
jgi:hypothetical protein